MILISIHWKCFLSTDSIIILIISIYNSLLLSRTTELADHVVHNLSNFKCPILLMPWTMNLIGYSARRSLDLFNSFVCVWFCCHLGHGRKRKETSPIQLIFFSLVCTTACLHHLLYLITSIFTVNDVQLRIISNINNCLNQPIRNIHLNKIKIIN